MTSPGTEELRVWRGDHPMAGALLGYARRTPSHAAKLRVFRLLARRLFPRGIPVRDDSGARMLIDPFDYVGHAVCFDGSYEPLSLALAKRLMTGGGTFLDVGSNVGLFTLTVAAVSGVRCISVEASAAAFAKLQANLYRNPGAQVTLVNAALAARASILRLRLREPSNIGSAQVAEYSASAPGEQPNVVPAITLDELLAALKTEAIAVMKLDVEGFEWEVLKGLDFSRPYRPESIIMEWVPSLGASQGDLTACFDCLAQRGYEPLTVAGLPYEASKPVPEENIWWRSR
jgi:FkbM family methyltransferase